MGRTRETSASDREIERYGALRDPASKDLQALVELTADHFGVRSAAINLITSDKQHQIAAAGFEPSICAREDSMCAVVVDEPEAVAVADASKDPRFADNPFVTGVIGSIRFYASAPLMTPEGVSLGRLCVFDDEPRELTAEQSHALEVLAGRVMDVLELRLCHREVEQSLGELTRTRDELRRSNEALAHFASQVSHDLRNPLMVISANAELLSSEARVADSPELAEMVREISDAGDRMSRLIRSVLAHASEGGGFAVGRVPLGPVFAQAVSDLRPVVGATAAEVVVHDLPDLPGDPDMLYAVAVNLLDNALKFTHAGVPPRVEVRAERRGDVWRVVVRDEGIGIPAQHAESVFLPYVRLSAGDPDGPDGSVDGHGVGLSTVKRIVESHGGRVGVDAENGAGATVWFELPASAADLDELAGVPGLDA